MMFGGENDHEDFPRIEDVDPWVVRFVVVYHVVLYAALGAACLHLVFG